MSLHWIDDADHWRCPVCGEYVTCPSICPDCKCPVCGFQDEKDKENDDAEIRRKRNEP